MRHQALLFLSFLAASCAAPPAESDDDEHVEQHWDSAGGNPTHPTHSLFAEYAITWVSFDHPEVAQYRKQIVAGANLELHDLPLTRDVTYEPLRREIGGNNWAADRPDLLWDKARASYAAGDKAQAWVYVGILLHYVQDMGVPAHAFHVIHQNRPWNWDTIEVLGFWDYHADMTTPRPADPAFVDPVRYLEWSGARAREHFHTAFPGVTYHRTFFPQGYADLTEQHWAFLRTRQADCANATAYALRSAAATLDGRRR